MLERFLPLWLCSLSLVAFYFPHYFVKSKEGLPYLFAATMFAIGWMLPRDELRQIARRWPAVLSGTAIQFSVMPVLAYSMGRLFGLGPELMIGIVLVGCVPGAMASNVLTLTARGNVSYSVSLTTAATLLSPVIVPLVTQWALPKEILISPMEQFWLLCWTVVTPVLLGRWIGGRFDRYRAVSRTIGSTFANLTILWIIAVVVALNRDNLEQCTLSVFFALLCVNLLGYLAGYGGGKLLRLPSPMHRALTLEIGMQNAGLGAFLAIRLFKDQPEAALPPALYTFGCMLTGTLLARVWAAWSQPDQNVTGPASA